MAEGTDVEDVTAEYVEARLADIAASRGDFEAAHGAEDDLHFMVLRAVANGHLDADAMRRLAALALRSLSIDFPRYCA